MISFKTSNTTKDLEGIIHLQKQNLPGSLTVSEAAEQGFVTVSHSLRDLQKVNSYEQSLIMKDGDEVIGYLLAMTKRSRADISILIPMFEMFDKIQYDGKIISDYDYIVVGQVCIAKEYRGQGLLDKAYMEYKEFFKDKYNFAITEIAIKNQRSVNAHKRVGFTEIRRYTDDNNTAWSIVVWDWRSL